MFFPKRLPGGHHMLTTASIAQAANVRGAAGSGGGVGGTGGAGAKLCVAVTGIKIL